MYLPDNIVFGYYSQVYNASYGYYSQVDNTSYSQDGYVFPCTADLPDLTMEIGGNKFVVPGYYLNYGNVSNTGM